VPVLSVKNGDKSPLPSFIVASWSPLSVLVETFQTVSVDGVFRSSPRTEPLYGPALGAWDTGPFAPCYEDDTQEAASVQRTKGEARMSEGSGRSEMERRLIEKSLEDEAFGQQLLADPKGAVEQEWVLPGRSIRVP
jgi:hypothetical protein